MSNNEPNYFELFIQVIASFCPIIIEYQLKNLLKLLKF